MIRLKDSEFEDIVQYMRSNYGINLEKKKVLVECRLTKELQKKGLDSFTEYLKMLKKDATGTIAGEMVNRLTTNYTYFLREPAHFSVLTEKIFPEILGRKANVLINIWCAGCSTGEECYTLAMALQDYRDEVGWMPSVQILATDISEEVLEIAQKGIYPKRELESIPEQWRRKYCREDRGKNFRVDEKLKHYIHFRRQNLMVPMGGEGSFDLIFCRNVMIYFNRESRIKLVRQMEKSLKSGGYLFIGHAELLSRDETELVQVYPAVYQRNSSS